MTGSSGANLRRRWRLAAWLAVWLSAIYFAIVVPVDRLVPAINHWPVALTLFLLSGVFAYGLLSLLVYRRDDAEELAQNICLLAAAVLVTLLAADHGFAAFLHADSRRLGTREILNQRPYDANVWDGEVMPKLYFPLGEYFWVYKPGQSSRAATFGEHYHADLLAHTLLMQSVLDRHDVEFVIDRYGLRNKIDPGLARVFVLGDSFAFGYHTTQDRTVPSVLTTLLGEPVYNLGVSATSPLHQVALLEYLLQAHPADFRPKVLLWFLFEGNDLEESKPPTRNQNNTSSPSLGDIIDGTLVGELANIPGVLRKQSIIHYAMRGGWATPFGDTSDAKHHELNGQRLVDPWYYSPTFGYRLFRQDYLDRASQPETYVSNHPNLPRVADAFRRMRTLADAHGFTVTVVTIPSAVRLYHGQFEELPAVSEAPYFLQHLGRLSRANGFGLSELFEMLRPSASVELLHYRDDTHWNERGHRVIAELLAQRLREAGGDSAQFATR